MKKIYASILSALIISSVADLLSQDTLRYLLPSDYATWQTLNTSSVSDDGNWISWHVSLVEGDDTLYIKNATTEKMYRYPLSSGLLFSTGSKWAVFRAGYSEKQLEKFTEQKKPVRYKARLLELLTGKERLFENISAFSFTKDGNHLIMAGYPPENSSNRDIFILNLRTGTLKNIGNISEYSVNKPGNRLAYIVNAENKKGNGVELLNLSDYTITFVDNDTCIYRNLVWDREGNAFTFLKAFSDSGYVEENHSVFLYRNILSKPELIKYNPATDSMFPAGLRISNNFMPVISDDQKTVFIGAHKWTVKEKKAGKPDESAKLPGVDIWHWKDDPVQPRQKNTYETEKNYTYRFAWIPDEKRSVKLTDDDMREIILSNDGRHAVVSDATPYKPSFREETFDHYSTDTRTGERKTILTGFTNLYGVSPAGKYVIYFKDKNWWVYDLYKNIHINISRDIPVDLWNTRDDSPREIKPPFGLAGWLKDDKGVLVYDEYDVWKINMDGLKPLRLTNGRENGIIFRLVRLNTEYPWIDPTQDLYFSAFGDIDKQMGYFRLTPKNRFEKLIYENLAVSGLRKAEKSEYLIYTLESYSLSPNVYRTNTAFTEKIKLSETNPRQSKFLWGRSELVHYKNANGKQLQGALFYPAGYEPGKKYPMIVYIYEIRSNVLNRYVVPSPRSSYNTTNYTSQGYFVFQPDIVYRTNHPGESAVECVVPAVEEVLKTGMIDEKKIGIMGHSWGAYQTSFIITRTKLFSAAVAGAPLTNMISMYNEIYWNTGTPNQNIFEISQGRLREPWWVILEEYMANSPMFQAKNITTPLLVTFGNNDGAVDWHQGIEMYTTMRRMEKPFIMLVYEGENHSLSKKENQTDYTRKVNEFFDHYLLGKEAPEWISKGKTYLNKKLEEEKAAKK